MTPRFLILDKNRVVQYVVNEGQRFGQWDFSIPGPLQGGRAIDLKACTEQDRIYWLTQIRRYP